MARPAYKIIKRGGRKSFVVRWFDPSEGRWRERSLGVTRRRLAEEAAEAILAKHAESDTPIADPGSWIGFQLKYESEKGPTLANVAVWKSAAKKFGSLVPLDDLTDVTAAALSQFEAKMRAAGLREATIRTYLKHIRAAINWAVDVELLPRAPKVRLPKLADDEEVRGRPVTGEEFDRWLVELKKHVGPQRAPAWLELMHGLWHSGLRLSEALNLTWDDQERLMLLNIEGRRPVLQIPAKRHKSRRYTVSPLTPDFVQFLRKMPKARRTGFVFNAPAMRKHPKSEVYRVSRNRDYVGRVISAAGMKANIIVARDGKRVKRASAHDTRRTFGDRWSQKVMPVVLKELMRHRSIDTTLKYYVGRDAEQTADVLWATLVTGGGDTVGGISPEPTPRPARKIPKKQVVKERPNSRAGVI